MLAGNPLKISAPWKSNVFPPISALSFRNISREPFPRVFFLRNLASEIARQCFRYFPQTVWLIRSSYHLLLSEIVRNQATDCDFEIGNIFLVKYLTIYVYFKIPVRSQIRVMNENEILSCSLQYQHCFNSYRLMKRCNIVYLLKYSVYYIYKHRDTSSYQF